MSHWIGGQKPDTGALLKLARYFNVDPEWLLDGDAPPVAQDAPGTAQKMEGRHRDAAAPKRQGQGKKTG